MKTVTMTELNQRISAITRDVIDSGEPVSVTNRGQVVMRLVPEPIGSTDPLAALVAAGRATPPRSPATPLARRSPVLLSRSIDELLADERDDERL